MEDTTNLPPSPPPSPAAEHFGPLEQGRLLFCVMISGESGVLPVLPRPNLLEVFFLRFFFGGEVNRHNIALGGCAFDSSPGRNSLLAWGYIKKKTAKKKTFQKKCTAGLEKAGRRFSFFRRPCLSTSSSSCTPGTHTHTHAHCLHCHGHFLLEENRLNRHHPVEASTHTLSKKKKSPSCPPHVTALRLTCVCVTADLGKSTPPPPPRLLVMCLVC